MTDVLFVIHNLYQEDFTFPLGIGYLSAVLEKNGYSVEVYCMDVYHYSNEDLAKKLEDNTYSIIGVGFLAARFKETIIDLCKVINKHKKSAWLVLGGHGPSALPEYMLETTKCDAVVVGEAENTILELMEDKKRDNCKEIYHSKPIRHLDDIPFPAWHLFPMDKYINSIFMKGMENGDRIFPIITSRGCTSKCGFCMRLEKGLRLRSIKNVIQEIKELKNRFKVNVLMLYDELFLISKKRLKQFKDLLKESKLRIKFTANARVDIFDEEIACLLKEMGCIHLNVGFESSNQDVLNHMKKNTTIEQNMNVLEISKRIGLPLGLNFIWGYEEDDKKSLTDNMNLIKKYNSYQQLRTIRYVTPYPGCELYYEAIDKGLISGPKEFFDKFNNSDLIAVNFTKYPDELCYKWLLEVNSELIRDYHKHTDNDMKSAEEMISQFRDLYNGKNSRFRGARHYIKS